MCEWLKEPAWKSIPFERADAHRVPPTQFRSTISRNIDMRRPVSVNHGVHPGFRGVCDTVLTQWRWSVPPTLMDGHRRVRRPEEGMRSRREGAPSDCDWYECRLGFHALWTNSRRLPSKSATL